MISNVSKFMFLWGAFSAIAVENNYSEETRNKQLVELKKKYKITTIESIGIMLFLLLESLK